MLNERQGINSQSLDDPKKHKSYGLGVLRTSTAFVALFAGVGSYYDKANSEYLNDMRETHKVELMESEKNGENKEWGRLQKGFFKVAQDRFLENYKECQKKLDKKDSIVEEREQDTIFLVGTLGKLSEQLFTMELTLSAFKDSLNDSSDPSKPQLPKTNTKYLAAFHEMKTNYDVCKKDFDTLVSKIQQLDLKEE